MRCFQGVHHNLNVRGITELKALGYPMNLQSESAVVFVGTPAELELIAIIPSLSTNANKSKL